MLQPRIMPCLLIRNNALVKTIKFTDDKYIGDPLNSVKIFNEKEVDELIVLDISATANDRRPNYGLIEQLASECRMPLCYGGGIRTTEEASRIFSLGVEKIALGSSAIYNRDLVAKIARQAGSQSVVVVVDVKKELGRYHVYSHNGTQRTGINFPEFIKSLVDFGAGEIVLNSIDRDGTLMGYDFDLVALTRDLVSVPITALGGAGSLNDFQRLFAEHYSVGAAAGSFFVLKGKYRAVLISYPSHSERESLYCL